MKYYVHENRYPNRDIKDYSVHKENCRYVKFPDKETCFGPFDTVYDAYGWAGAEKQYRIRLCKICDPRLI